MTPRTMAIKTVTTITRVVKYVASCLVGQTTFLSSDMVSPTNLNLCFPRPFIDS